jgi:hypothetical protein
MSAIVSEISHGTETNLWVAAVAKQVWALRTTHHHRVDLNRYTPNPSNRPSLLPATVLPVQRIAPNRFTGRLTKYFSNYPRAAQCVSQIVVPEAGGISLAMDPGFRNLVDTDLEQI